MFLNVILIAQKSLFFAKKKACITHFFKPNNIEKENIESFHRLLSKKYESGTDYVKMEEILPLCRNKIENKNFIIQNLTPLFFCFA